MTDNHVNHLSQALPLRYAAVQQILGLAGMASQRDEDGRLMPAKVYPAPSEAPGWVVEPPAPQNGSMLGNVRTFTGSAALLQALEFAQRTYGSALYLSR